LMITHKLRADMIWIWTGIITFAATAAGFWFSLPVNGQVRPFVNTIVEPYVSILWAGGLVISIGSVVRGIAEVWL
jgi:hypothetical protein